MQGNPFYITMTNRALKIKDSNFDVIIRAKHGVERCKLISIFLLSVLGKCM